MLRPWYAWNVAFNKVYRAIVWAVSLHLERWISCLIFLESLLLVEDTGTDSQNVVQNLGFELWVPAVPWVKISKLNKGFSSFFCQIFVAHIVWTVNFLPYFLDALLLVEETERVPETRVLAFGYLPAILRVKSELYKDFLHVLPNFCCPYYLMIFQSGSHRRCCGTLKNPQIWQRFGKKMKKRLVQLALNPFFSWFWVPVPHIILLLSLLILKYSNSFEFLYFFLFLVFLPRLQNFWWCR